ncbi:isochorismatase family [Histoplasma capsulatum var. duboisii H88]|uniref:Isochorismatase family n=1 Tax=Ajellomyces capsulatus (strain H88) TaxID=544711 RepID=F0UGW4_AJEC8|nr:isochorismatase family [Histoplasma capsulatum var. duboisii H88]QSS55972.1 isochorismatase family [Histoplasma capsulatum var. duboisii H88]
MFPANLLSQSFPNVPCRKALLILDLQNDFVKPDGALFVRNVPEFLDTVAALAQRFRETGEVVWVQTQFEHRRPIFSPESGGEVIVVDKLLASGNNNDNDNDNTTSKSANDKAKGANIRSHLSSHSARHRSENTGNTNSSSNGGAKDGSGRPNSSQRRQKRISGGESRREQFSVYSDDPEAFLSVLPKGDGARRCCLQKTVGCQFPAPILSAIDHERDTILVKSDYSAFQSESLLLSFRTQFVRELYICGSLSNVSVYATALDAVSHGLDVILVEDCLGFRSFARHEEAMRRMADMMGANGITSKELAEEQDWEEAAVPSSEWPEHSAASTPVGIEDDMGVLAVKSPPKQPSQQKSDDAPLDVEDQEPEGDELADDLLEPSLRSTAPQPREAPLTSASATATTPSSDLKGKSNRARMRKPRRTVSRDDTSQAERTQSQRQSVDMQQLCGATSGTRRSRKSKHNQTDLGPDDSIGEGDSRIIYDLALPPKSFQLLREEVNWQKMYHLSGQVPRLVAVQGAVQPDNSVPIYRHPADESPPLFPFSKIVNNVRHVVEKHIGHHLNHVLIQLYRDGQDRISEHSDKTLDIVRGSYICNVSFGAQRTMTLRTKSSAAKAAASTGDTSDAADGGDEETPKESSTERQTQRIPLPHNSLFILGEKTNMRWLHAIRADKRPESEKSPEELAYGGQRISLTFRHIGTFIHPESDTIWGQGAISKTKQTAGQVIHGDCTETTQMIRAFGQENQQSDFNWEANYGQGFNVVNFVTTSAGKLRLSGDDVADLRVQICFAEYGVRYDIVAIDDFPAALKGTLSLPHKSGNLEPRPVYMDVDGSTCFTGDDCILLHVAKQKGLIDHERSSQPQSQPQAQSKGPSSIPHQRRQQRAQPQQPTLASTLHETDDLLRSWRRFQKLKTPHGVLQKMDVFEAMLRRKPYLAGQLFGIEDCALWPVVRDIIREVGHLDEMRFPSLIVYYNKVGKRGCVRTALEELEGAAAARG